MASRRKGRILAFQALYSWEASVGTISTNGTVGTDADGVASIPEDLLNFSWLEADKQAALDADTLAFSRLMITGVVENIVPVDDMIRRHLQNWDFSRLNRVDLAVLRLSVYTLMYQTGISPSIVIDEAIGIAREFGTEESFRFINGVLDSIRKTIQGQPVPVP
ncbi:N utilization substance protein B [Spirochaetia bacterium]|nr:N utilization substance protein B [Spirochaetia bacterium]